MNHYEQFTQELKDQGFIYMEELGPFELWVCQTCGAVVERITAKQHKQWHGLLRIGLG